MSEAAQTRLLAIDPGTTNSAAVVLCGGAVRHASIYNNNDLLRKLRSTGGEWDRACIEMVACYGMAVGREVFETCVWIGRFQEAMEFTGTPTFKLVRMQVKSHLCHSAKANDANIRAALIDLYGPGKERAIGLKHSPGPLYGIKQDLWAALALAVTASAQLGFSISNPTTAVIGDSVSSEPLFQV